ncbi:hypothetical protein VTJ49DRAFT_784 [Mycothermus thermophilus]|uniref:Polymerase nucleotidyl transferase domain-containing protein n=1 Tax=Humicola insolens TaxID=85995 RepID=A0ABR3VE36_HUMIN
MHPHHTSTLTNSIAYFSANPDVLAVLLSGSIAHGFETASSDVDLLVVLTDSAHARLRDTGARMTFVSHDLATYEGGYVDAKYVSLAFLREVAERGSEPARWALEGVKVVFVRGEEGDGKGEEGMSGLRGELEEVLSQVVRYPVEGKTERIMRFRAQLDAWKWFCGEGRSKGNGYLLGLAVRKLILFGGRLVLAHNEMLYPFHKWFLRVLGGVKEKPEGLMECITRLLEDPSEANVDELYEMIKGFREWEETPNGWGAQFMLDNELTWMTGHTPVDDL